MVQYKGNHSQILAQKGRDITNGQIIITTRKLKTCIPSLKSSCLYTIDPLKEAIHIALRKLYKQDEPPSIARKTMKKLLKMAVSQVHFKCKETQYDQKDGLAMGASLAIILANLWLKQYETALSSDFLEMFLPQKDLNGICHECKKNTYRSKGVECECCLNWYHVKCGDKSDDEYRNISETILISEAAPPSVQEKCD